MDCHFLFLLLGFWLCMLLPLASQTSAHVNEGVLKQPTNGKRLLLQVGEPQAAKPQAEKEREVNKSGHKQDAVVASSETGASLVAELPAGTGHDNATKKDLKPTKSGPKSGDEETHPSSVPAPLPSVDRKDGTPMEGNETYVTKPVPSRDNDTNSETNSQKAVKNCGGSHCEDSKRLISACLSIPGDRPHKFSLFITYEGDTSVLVKVIAPEFLIADPLEVSVSKGKSETIQFSMDSNYKMDSEVMQNKTINVYGDCEIEVPVEYLRDERAPILPSVEPRVIAYLLVFVVIVSSVGAWLCCKCRGKKRAGDVKYQQLEMNGAGQSTPKERVEEAWDEVWDDGWEDTEAAKSSSRLTQSLSSRGLAARRGTKDVWDNSWED